MAVKTYALFYKRENGEDANISVQIVHFFWWVQCLGVTFAALYFCNKPNCMIMKHQSRKNAWATTLTVHRKRLATPRTAIWQNKLSPWWTNSVTFAIMCQTARPKCNALLQSVHSLWYAQLLYAGMQCGQNAPAVPNTFKQSLKKLSIRFAVTAKDCTFVDAESILLFFLSHPVPPKEYACWRLSLQVLAKTHLWALHHTQN